MKVARTVEPAALAGGEPTIRKRDDRPVRNLVVIRGTRRRLEADGFERQFKEQRTVQSVDESHLRVREEDWLNEDQGDHPSNGITAMQS
jgi:hypothetical protein